MPFGPLRAVVRSLRFRLMLWNAGVVLLLVLITLVGVREGVRRALLAEVTEVLDEDLLEIGLAVGRFAPDLRPLYEELARKAQGHARHGWFVQLVDTDGRLLWASRDVP